MAVGDTPDERPSDGTPAENKKNIAYHYDVSNAFYALWLDREMVYTCGYFTGWDNDIDRVQQDKLEMICRKLRLKPGNAARHRLRLGRAVLLRGAELRRERYAVTLSGAQVAYGQEKIKRLASASVCGWRLNTPRSRACSTRSPPSACGAYRHRQLFEVLPDGAAC
jgi:cyclopropane-fatty-acyl-phospholipid synthase